MLVGVGGGEWVWDLIGGGRMGEGGRGVPGTCEIADGSKVRWEVLLEKYGEWVCGW